MPTRRRIGVILAAGRGRRMGNIKQLVDLHTTDGEKPLVAAAFDAVRPICDEMIVVLGHEPEAVAAALGERAFQTVDADADAPMFESIRAGLRVARDLDPAAAIVLQPGDHPEVALTTLDALTARSIQRPDQAIIPAHRGQGGHPALIPPAIAKMLIDADCPHGLGQYWTEHPELTERIPVDDAGVLRDIDLPGDLDNR